MQADKHGQTKDDAHMQKSSHIHLYMFPNIKQKKNSTSDFFVWKLKKIVIAVTIKSNINHNSAVYKNEKFRVDSNRFLQISKL